MRSGKSTKDKLYRGLAQSVLKRLGPYGAPISPIHSHDESLTAFNERALDECSSSLTRPLRGRPLVDARCVMSSARSFIVEQHGETTCGGLARLGSKLPTMVSADSWQLATPHRRTPIEKLKVVAFAHEQTSHPLRTNIANSQLSELRKVFLRPRGREVKATVLYTVEAAAR